MLGGTAPPAVQFRSEQEKGCVQTSLWVREFYLKLDPMSKTKGEL